MRPEVSQRPTHEAGAAKNRRKMEEEEEEQEAEAGNNAM